MGSLGKGTAVAPAKQHQRVHCFLLNGKKNPVCVVVHIFVHSWSFGTVLVAKITFSHQGMDTDGSSCPGDRCCTRETAVKVGRGNLTWNGCVCVQVVIKNRILQ